MVAVSVAIVVVLVRLVWIGPVDNNVETNKSMVNCKVSTKIDKLTATGNVWLRVPAMGSRERTMRGEQLPCAGLR